MNGVVSNIISTRTQPQAQLAITTRQAAQLNQKTETAHYAGVSIELRAACPCKKVISESPGYWSARYASARQLTEHLEFPALGRQTMLTTQQ